MKNTVIKLGVFPFDVMVSIGETDSELRKSCIAQGIDFTDEEYKSLEFESTDVGRAWMDTENRTYIRLKDSPQTPKGFGTLSHEILHAVSYVLDNINVPLNTHTEEVYAYTIDYLTQQIYERFKLPKPR